MTFSMFIVYKLYLATLTHLFRHLCLRKSPENPLGASDGGWLHGMFFVVHDFVRGVENCQDLAPWHRLDLARQRGSKYDGTNGDMMEEYGGFTLGLLYINIW